MPQRRFPLTIFALLLCLFTRSQAGPPYLTDDPEPVELHHWEIDVGTQVFRTSEGWNGSLPIAEYNYGILPETELTLFTPVDFNHDNRKFHYGYGDTEFAIKYRILKEEDDRWWPQIAIYPQVNFPTGNEKLGLGNGKSQTFLPVWMQKAFGKEWTLFGGGGWWYNPGVHQRDYWYTGAVLERKLSEKLAVGLESFHTTPDLRDGSSQTGMNLGATYDLSDTYHLLVSAGHSVQGPAEFFGYAALQITFGPEGEKEKNEGEGKAKGASGGGR